MQKVEATGRIRFVKAPPHPIIPEHIRRIWIGVSVPCWPFMSSVSGSWKPAQRSDEMPLEPLGHMVPEDGMFAALVAARHFDQMSWYRSQGYPHDKPATFYIGASLVEIVSGVDTSIVRPEKIEEEFTGHIITPAGKSGGTDST